MKFSLVILILLCSISCMAQKPFFPQYDATSQKWHYLDLSGNEVLEITLPGMENMQPFSDGLAAAQDLKTHLWGFIDEKGKWAIKPMYDQAQEFTGGYAIVGKHCASKCNPSDEGLLNDYISHVITQKNEVVFTDNSQDPNQQLRFFLDKNLGDGLFRVTFGYGYNDMKNVINLKGEYLCDTYSIFGRGNIEYDAELKIFRCWKKFYRLNGDLFLDLGKYAFMSMPSEGYIWAEAEEIISEDESMTHHILLDLKGNEVLNMKDEDFKAPSAVENGTFTYINGDYETLVYHLADKQSTPYEEVEIELEPGMTAGPRLKNGMRYIYDQETVDASGFINASGEIFYKIRKPS